MKQWFLDLETTRRQEAVETLPGENVLQEAGGTFEMDGQWYACVFMVTDGPKQPMDMKLPVNQEHYKVFDECFEPNTRVKGTVWYNVKA